MEWKCEVGDPLLVSMASFCLTQPASRVSLLECSLVYSDFAALLALSLTVCAFSVTLLSLPLCPKLRESYRFLHR